MGLKKKGLSFSLADAHAHAAKHGYTLEVGGLGGTAGNPADAVQSKIQPKLPQPVKMSRPEREMGMMLEAQKRAGEIVDYRFQGMSLAYGEDPETGILLRYKCDWVVILGGGDPKKEMTGLIYNLPPATRFKIIECKGSGKHAISAAAKLRFKGAKAAWPMFQFEMWQRLSDGQWRRVL